LTYTWRKKINAVLVIDILNGNTEKIMYMLDAIKYWSNSRKSSELEVVNTNCKKMASGGTFGEDDQYKLRELEIEETESILPPS
jgi:hypothetical protein